MSPQTEAHFRYIFLIKVIVKVVVICRLPLKGVKRISGKVLRDTIGNVNFVAIFRFRAILGLMETHLLLSSIKNSLILHLGAVCHNIFGEIVEKRKLLVISVGHELFP